MAGSCTITPALLNCSLGTLGPGVERTIGISARVTQTGTYVELRDGDRERPGHERRQQHGLRVDARHCARHPADDAEADDAEADDAEAGDAEAASRKPTPDVCRVLTVTPGLVRASARSQSSSRR